MFEWKTLLGGISEVGTRLGMEEGSWRRGLFCRIQFGRFKVLRFVVVSVMDIVDQMEFTQLT